MSEPPPSCDRGWVRCLCSPAGLAHSRIARLVGHSERFFDSCEFVSFDRLDDGVLQMSGADGGDPKTTVYCTCPPWFDGISSCINNMQSLSEWMFFS